MPQGGPEASGEGNPYFYFLSILRTHGSTNLKMNLKQQHPLVPTTSLRRDTVTRRLTVTPCQSVFIRLFLSLFFVELQLAPSPPPS